MIQPNLKTSIENWTCCLQTLKKEKLVIEHHHKSAQKILEMIRETVFAFGKKSKLHDDDTVVFIKRLRS